MTAIICHKSFKINNSMQSSTSKADKLLAGHKITLWK
jgi:hypothetical protein